MIRPTRARIAAAVIATAALAAACGGGSDPTPQPTTVSDVVDDAAQPAAGVTQYGRAVNQAKDVAADLEARNSALEN